MDEKDFDVFLTHLMSKVGKERMLNLIISYQRARRKKGKWFTTDFTDFIQKNMGKRAFEFYEKTLLGQKGYNLSNAPQDLRKKAMAKGYDFSNAPQDLRKKAMAKGYDFSNAPQDLRKRNLASTPTSRFTKETGEPDFDADDKLVKEQTMLKENRYRDEDYVDAVSHIAIKYGDEESIFTDASQGIYRDLGRETYDEDLKKSVRKLQKKLGFKGREVDGWFGSKTACALRNRLNPNIKIGCFKKEWVMQLADNLREEELANARKGANKPKPKKAKAKKINDDRSRASFDAYFKRLQFLNRRITKVQNLEKIGVIKMRDADVRKELTKMRKQLKALKKELEADKNLKNPKMLTQHIPDEIQRIDDMLGDPLGIDNSGLKITDKDVRKFSDVGTFKFKESKFSNDKELQNLMESFKKFTRND